MHGVVRRGCVGAGPAVRCGARRRDARGTTATIAVVVTIAWLGVGSPAVGAPSAEGDAGIEPVTEEGDDAADAEERAEAARAAAEEIAARRLREAERDLERARAALRTSRATLEATWAAGRAADGRVRREEEQLPALVIRQLELAAELQVVGGDLDRARTARADARAELVTARDALADQAVRTFKTGSAAELTGPVAVLREARDPGQLVRGLADLRAVTRDGARSVRAIEAELVELEVELTRLRVRRTELVAELTEAEQQVSDQEDTAAGARASADGQEARVIAAMANEVAADRALTRARQRYEDRRAERAELRAEGAAPDPSDADATDVAGADTEAGDATADLDDRVRAVEGRRRAHQRALRLTADQRRTAASWVCPVAEARFANDWAFPRSGARRHEGTDVFAARGTPIVAVTPGTVTVLDTTEGPGDLGGITVTIADGDSRQYYAHLERIDPDLRRGGDVAAGDRVGWVGTTGNARGTPPHLHLGWYVDDVAVNPFASLAVACDGDARPALPTDVVPVLDDSDEVAPVDEEAAGPRSPARLDQGWRTPSPARTAR